MCGCLGMGGRGSSKVWGGGGVGKGGSSRVVGEGGREGGGRGCPARVKRLRRRLGVVWGGVGLVWVLGDGWEGVVEGRGREGGGG